MNKNIEFDRVVGMQDPKRTGYLYQWLTKDSHVTYEMFVPTRKLVTRNHICPACFIWRGELIEMDESQRCPLCRGKYASDGCDCGEVPHSATCPMTSRSNSNK